MIKLNYSIWLLEFYKCIGWFEFGSLESFCMYIKCICNMECIEKFFINFDEV